MTDAYRKWPEISEYLRRKKILQKDFSFQLGCDPAHLSRMINGKKGISRSLKLAIRDVTKGELDLL